MSRRLRADAGFTLVELLVGITIFGVLGTMVMSAALTTGRVSDTNTTTNDLNAEARNVLNRMTRELREAERIVDVENPVGPGYDSNADTSLTVNVDFDGDGTIEPDAADPEVLTYRYQHGPKRLILEAGTSSVPVLAANVEQFKLSYWSRIGTTGRLALDGLPNAPTTGCAGLTASGTKDNELTWSELDADPTGKYGDCSGSLTAAELPYVNAVGIELTVLKSPRQQPYRTRVDLRNNRS